MIGSKTQQWPGQSLAEGAAGIALLYMERGDFDGARALIDRAVAGGVSVAANASLFYGAPALEFVLSAATAHGLPVPALSAVQAATDRIVAARLEAAVVRRSRGELPNLSEFDLIRGLAGCGALLLHRGQEPPQLAAVLSYLVDLTHPIRDDGEELPGWWVPTGPNGKPSEEFPGGHGNNGMAHGVAGPLAVLALAMRAGVEVPGHREAIERITAWLAVWQRPYWVTREQIRTRQVSAVPARPSWCYGALGLARAEQLAALALGDRSAAAAAENAAYAALTDPGVRDLTGDGSLCHGWAGLITTAAAIAEDCPGPAYLAGPIALLATELSAAEVAKDGFLEGSAGGALALHRLNNAPATGWTRALLID
ncbi:Lanthionine synthetase C family protein [Catenulispora acidiphila DSM 44928]|uniref:Lanthionine synthetase C family protein n=1 Tax=Catenulispora acidiphila (strain DSM 44928 / JCM 14897 / NBRC 102108 / NRRL B-24433 / ID139908) TaxID=479433 RepID=C7QEQ0_CATAD|nr:lanthionine synthetase C family protein [Catenulispora acidiphila]ACU72820.1 Lanthionine synthetase C family protein [Catenulispora acidiphila DSM 44928]